MEHLPELPELTPVSSEIVEAYKDSLPVNRVLYIRRVARSVIDKPDVKVYTNTKSSGGPFIVIITPRGGGDDETFWADPEALDRTIGRLVGDEYAISSNDMEYVEITSENGEPADYLVREEGEGEGCESDGHGSTTLKLQPS